eukprot:CAMPEP_0178437376 /NCGR_PEP_ID=MMETSP0689_2-20121128/34957_1 /TAXON_ID=160604 /ORGANISM="Amphidinium massartii, Strain CS-259" /LENGTH=98 /DNA_ID=CAMNT_0020059569 /DNA_START=221 /DNA_END=514 /DNA_ORIENTATION=+
MPKAQRKENAGGHEVCKQHSSFPWPYGGRLTPPSNTGRFCNKLAPARYLLLRHTFGPDPASVLNLEGNARTATAPSAACFCRQPWLRAFAKTPRCVAG